MKFILLIYFAITTSWANEICLHPAAQETAYWYKKTSQRIDEAIIDTRTQGLSLQVMRNLLVTQAYLEYFKTAKNPNVTLMGYVYAHASHHLGRLVRYKYWDQLTDSNEWKQLDYSLIRGRALERTVATFPQFLATRLMDFSLDLFKTLSTQLTILETCGATFAAKLTENAQLKMAYNSKTPTEFMQHFVAFEQSYLQKTMYAQLDIMTATKSGMLDPMRFIPFNGKRTISFAEWRELEGIKGTSFDLAQRIRFDQMVIHLELIETDFQRNRLFERFTKTQIENMLAFLLQSLE